MRTFIAIDLPRPVRESIGSLQAELKRQGDDVRWVRPEGMHLTLRFLGEIDPELVTGIGDVLERAAAELRPFEIGLAGLGAFPDLARPRVIWVGVTGDIESIQLLKKRIDAGLGGLGFEPEDRPFKPHITLGRVTGRVDGRRLIGEKDFQSNAFTANRISLIRSILKPTGAEYNEILSRSFTAGRRKQGEENGGGEIG